METTNKQEDIPTIRRGSNTYKPEDIRRWGIKRFMEKVAPKKPFPIPDLEFTREEDQRMNELLNDERSANDL